jgi:hypothetical protein
MLSVHTLGEWNCVLVYAEDGRREIDNKPCERAIRPNAFGKKNSLFFRGEKAEERSVIVYRRIENCRRRGIDLCATPEAALTWAPAMNKLADRGHHAGNVE